MAIKQSNDPDPSLGLAEDIQGEFTGTNPVSLSEYYRGGSFVPDIPLNTTISTSNAISFSMFYGTQANTPAVGTPVITDNVGVVIPNVYVGRELYVNVSGISDADGIQTGSFEVKWTNLTNPTGSEAFVASSVPDGNGVLSVTVTATTVGEEWQAEVKFLDTPGDETIFTSASVTVEVFSAAPSVTVFLDSNDTPNVYQGSVLSSSITSFFNPPGTLTRQWQRLAGGTTWTDISGATGNTYTVSALNAYREEQIRLRATETLILPTIPDISVSGFSNAVGPAVNFPATGIVELRAEPETASLAPGVTLLADASNITDRDGITDFTYRWTRSDIGGGNPVVVQTAGGTLSTTNTYTTNQSTDADKDFSVSVTVTDGIGNSTLGSQFNNIENPIVSNTVTVTNATAFTVTNNQTSVEEGQSTRFNFQIQNAIAEVYNWEITGSTQVLSQVSNTTGTIGANETSVISTSFNVDVLTVSDGEYSSGADAIGDLTFTVTGANSGATESLTISLTNEAPVLEITNVSPSGAGADGPEGQNFTLTIQGTNVVGNENISVVSGGGGLYTLVEQGQGSPGAIYSSSIPWGAFGASTAGVYEATVVLNTVADDSTWTSGSVEVTANAISADGTDDSAIILLSNTTPQHTVTVDVRAPEINDTSSTSIFTAILLPSILPANTAHTFTITRVSGSNVSAADVFSSATSGSITISDLEGEDELLYSLNANAASLITQDTVFRITIRDADGTTRGTGDITVLDIAGATYTLSAPTNIDEGQTLTVALATTSLPQGTVVPYTLSGIQSADVGNNPGQFVLAADGTASVDIPIIADSLTENNQTLTLSLTNGADSVDVIINDTSLTPTVDVVQVPITIDEGETATINVSTSNIPNGTTLNWRFAQGGSSFDITTGSFTIDGDGNGSFDITPTADGVADGDKSAQLAVGDTASGISERTSVSFTVRDIDTTFGPEFTNSSGNATAAYIINAGADLVGTEFNEADVDVDLEFRTDGTIHQVTNRTFIRTGGSLETSFSDVEVGRWASSAFVNATNPKVDGIDTLSITNISQITGNMTIVGGLFSIQPFTGDSIGEARWGLQASANSTARTTFNMTLSFNGQTETITVTAIVSIVRF